MLRKKDRERIENLQKSIDLLQHTLDMGTISKAKQYDVVRENLANLNLKVKKANVRISDDGIPYVDVLYVTNAKVFITEDLSTKSEPRFASINLLNLLNKEDTQKLKDAISKAKNLVKNLK